MSPKERTYVAHIELYRVDKSDMRHMRNIIRDVSKEAYFSCTDGRTLKIANISRRDFNLCVERLEKNKEKYGHLCEFTPKYLGTKREERRREVILKTPTINPVRIVEEQGKQISHRTQQDKYGQVIGEFLNKLEKIEYPRTLRNAYFNLENYAQCNPQSRREKISLEACVELLDIFKGSENELALNFHFDVNNPQKKKEYVLNQGILNRLKKELESSNPINDNEKEKEMKKKAYAKSLENKVVNYETERQNHILALKTRVNGLKSEMKTFEIPVYQKIFPSGNIGFYLKGAGKEYQFAVLDYSESQNTDLSELRERMSVEIKTRYGVGINFIEINDQEKRANAIRKEVQKAIIQEILVAGKPLSAKQILEKLHEWRIGAKQTDIRALAREGILEKVGSKRGTKYTVKKRVI